MNEEENQIKFAMKSGLILFGGIALFISMCIIGGSIVSAVECNADLNGTNGYGDGVYCDINSNLVLNGTYNFYLNGTSSGVIRFVADDIYLDCNSSTFIGNSSSGLRAIYWLRRNNVTVRNCNFVNFSLSILADQYTNNSFVDNSNFSGYGNGIEYRNTLNSSVTNSIFNNLNDSIFNGVSSYTINAQFINNTFNYGSRVLLYNSNSSYFFNNYFNHITTRQMVFLEGSFDGVLDSNHFYNHTSYGMIKLQRSSNFSILNNVFNLSDISIWVTINNSNILIQNNSIYNARTNDDSWATAIAFEMNNTHVSVINNTIIDYGCIGVLVRMTSNYLIQGNYFNSYNGINCINEAPYAIGILELYKTYLGGGAGTLLDNRSSLIGSYASRNGVILDNSFGNNVNVFVRNQGDINLSHDLSDFWYRAFQYKYLIDKDEFFISNLFNNVSNYNQSLVLNYNLWIGWKLNKYFEFNLFKDYDFYKRVNLTYGSPIEVFNKSNALIYNTNGSIYGSSNIQDNDGNINITLPPNNVSYVLDNYNLTEGVNRENSPIWFSSTSLTLKHIASNLTNNVNVPTIFDVLSCNSVGTIKYTTDIGTETNYLPEDYSCSNNKVLITLDIYPASASNVLEISYDASALETEENSILSLSRIIKGFGILGFAIILVLVILIIQASYTGNMESLTNNDLTSKLLLILMGILFAVLVVSIIVALI